MVFQSDHVAPDERRIRRRAVDDELIEPEAHGGEVMPAETDVGGLEVEDGAPDRQGGLAGLDDDTVRVVGHVERSMVISWAMVVHGEEVPPRLPPP